MKKNNSILLKNKISNLNNEKISLEIGIGSKLIDKNSNEYIDMNNASGTFIIGHSHPYVIEAIKKNIDDGLSFKSYKKRKDEFEEIILNAFYHYDFIKILNSANEAAFIAEKKAKEYTNRDIIIKFNERKNQYENSSTIIAEINDQENIDELFKRYENRIAAIIIEPLMTKYGLFEHKRKYIKYLREISWKNGTLLIFDEITSGFRFKFSGYYQFMGIIPDMIILGKIIGGGIPIGAIVGFERMINYKEYKSNCYGDEMINGNMIALSAGISTLKILFKGEVYKKIDNFGNKIAFEINKSKNAKCRQIGSIIWPLFDSSEIPENPEQIKMNNIINYKKIIRNMMKKGYFLSPSPYEAIYLSNAHDEKQINKFSSILMEEINELKKNHKEEERNA